MPRCVTCDGALHKTEMACLMCGTPVVVDPNKVTVMDRLCTGLKVAAIFSGILTIASIFTDFTPSFTKCAVATLILVLAKSSAGQMTEKSR